MKRHPGLLAAGLLLFVVLACNLGKNSNNSNNNNRNANANTTSTTKKPNRVNPEVYVTRIYMAKSENGKPGDETSTFAPDDHQIFCVAEFNKAKGGTQIRTVWRAIDVQGDKDKEIKAFDYKMKSFEKKVQGHLRLPSDWPKGRYGVEIYINNELDKTIEYSIE
jgi:hypothetical protein